MFLYRLVLLGIDILLAKLSHQQQETFLSQTFRPLYSGPHQWQYTIQIHTATKY